MLSELRVLQSICCVALIKTAVFLTVWSHFTCWWILCVHVASIWRHSSLYYYKVVFVGSIIKKETFLSCTHARDGGHLCSLQQPWTHIRCWVLLIFWLSGLLQSPSTAFEKLQWHSTWMIIPKFGMKNLRLEKHKSKSPSTAFECEYLGCIIYEKRQKLILTFI